MTGTTVLGTSDGDVRLAATALAEGRLVAFPTETVYGLGADAGNPTAVNRIFEAKGRPTGHPLIVHIADRSDLQRFGTRIDPMADKLAAAFWPGPLTIIVERSELVVPEAVGGRSTVGLRVPDHPVALDLLRAFGGGVAGPSANRFGSVSPTTAAHVVDDLDGVVDMVLDGGPCRIGVESTIIDVTAAVPALLRPGGISTVEVEAVLGQAIDDDRAGPSRASGMLTSHYAPRAAVSLAAGADQAEAALEARFDGERVGLIAPFESDREPSWQLPDAAEGFGAGLYATLRAADRVDIDRLVIVPPSTGHLLDAVIDRLTKAAAPRS